MVCTGFLLFAGSLSQADRPLPFTIGLAVGGVPAALLAQLVLAFPDGRLHSRKERLLAAAAYVDAIVLHVLMLMFMGFEHVTGCPCPKNLLLVSDDEALHGTLMSAQRVAGVVITANVAVILIRRWYAGSAPLRRAIAPILLTGTLTAMLFGATLVADQFSARVARGFDSAQRVALAAVPIAYLLGLFRARLARAGVSDLMLELGRMPGPGGLRDALARALGDPSLELAYWIPETAGYVGIDGQPLEVVPEAGRAVTKLERRGDTVAALIHDPALSEDRGLLDAVSSAAGLALENERLLAELRAQLEEIRESRARIVEAGDNERRRLERNLHDGAQQRLVSLALVLGLAEAKVAADPEKATELVRSAREELQLALHELRELARGIHPAVLTDRGLKEAIAALAERAPLPVEAEVELTERLPLPIEAAAYYVVAEALTNIAKYAAATTARVRLSRANDVLRIEVSDDGVGGADAEVGSGLRGLADRVEALDGRVRVESPRSQGTRVLAEIPLPVTEHALQDPE